MEFYVWHLHLFFPIRAHRFLFHHSSCIPQSEERVKTITKKVILIDGEQLAEFMIDYGIGVSTSTSYEVKKLDSDYFGE